MSLSRISTITAVLLFISAGSAAAAVCYVSPTGSDNNEGRTEAMDWLTISKAATVLTAGDTVYVKAGNYL